MPIKGLKLTYAGVGRARLIASASLSKVSYPGIDKRAVAALEAPRQSNKKITPRCKGPLILFKSSQRDRCQTKVNLRKRYNQTPNKRKASLLDG
jgi:hypothetical protein